MLRRTFGDVNGYEKNDIIKLEKLLERNRVLAAIEDELKSLSELEN